MSGNPLLSVRISKDLNIQIEKRIQESGLTKSQIVINALSAYLSDPAIEQNRTVNVADLAQWMEEGIKLLGVNIKPVCIQEQEEASSMITDDDRQGYDFINLVIPCDDIEASEYSKNLVSMGDDKKVITGDDSTALDSQEDALLAIDWEEADKEAEQWRRKKIATLETERKDAATHIKKSMKGEDLKLEMQAIEEFHQESLDKLQTRFELRRQEIYVTRVTDRHNAEMRALKELEEKKFVSQTYRGI